MARKYRMYVELDGKRFAVTDYPFFLKVEEMIQRVEVGLDRHRLMPVPKGGNEVTTDFREAGNYEAQR